MKQNRVSFFVLWLILLSLGHFSFAQVQTNSLRPLDRSRLPAAVRNVPLDRLSSGALLRLDRDGDLVESAGAWTSRVHALPQKQQGPQPESVALDPRVASNIRLGDDPPALPSNQRAQAEPHIIRSSINADFVLATVQEGRYASGGGSIDCGYAVSHDGGLSWTRALIPGLTSASGGPYFRATDPVAGISTNGNAYLNTIAAIDQQFTTAAVVVNRSTDGGNTFGNPVLVYQSPNDSIFPDKNWMAINNFAGTPTAGRIVVTFSQFTNANANGAPIARSISDDGGVTWSPIAFIHSSSTDAQGSQPVFLPNGHLAVIYWNFNGTQSFSDDFLALVVSTNGGNTFGAEKTIAHVNYYSESQIRNGSFLPSATTDRTTGKIYVVYQGLFNGSPRILFTKSANEGTTWTTPIAISDNPGGSGVFNAAIAASDDGQTLTATFYDHRNNPSSNTLVDLYLAQSFDGGATWQPNIRVTSDSTDAALAPLTSEGYMLGDYLGIANAANPNVPAVPVWVDTRTGNPDPFVARVGIAPSFDFTSWQAAHLSLGQINNPSLGGQAGDADGDLEDNKSEFLSGTDPNNPNSVVRTGTQLNISTRARVESGEQNVLIGGFIITGSSQKRVIARAIGPSLSAFGVPGSLQDPTLELVPQSGSSIFNDNWQDSDAAAIQATGIPPNDPHESAIVRTLDPGPYTAIVRGKGNTSGIALVEIYDLQPANGAQLRNISSRGFVNVDDNIMIGGLIIGAGLGVNAAGSSRVVVRGIGPSLGAFGISSPLQDPELLLFNANGDTVAANDNWRSTQEAEIQATGLAPSDDRESAVVLALPQGNYTAQLRGVNRTTGVGLIEVYQVD